MGCEKVRFHMLANDKKATKWTCTVYMWLLWIVKIYMPIFELNTYIAIVSQLKNNGIIFCWTSTCIMCSVICFLMARGEELSSIHCQVCYGRPVTSAKRELALLYPTSLLLYWANSFVMNFIILIILTNSHLIWNVIYFVSNKWLVMGLCDKYRPNVISIYVHPTTSGR